MLGSARLAGLALLLALSPLGAALPAGASERVADVARFQGTRANALVGYGLVVGLAGTGDDSLVYTLQSMRSATTALGIQIPPGVNAQLKNAAAVMLTAELPPYAKPGQRIDVTVSALGRAKSLRGGTLLMAPLQGPDGQTWALAQGSLTVAGFGAQGADGSRIVVNTPTSGRIPGGAMVERAAPSMLVGPSGEMLLDLMTPSFTNAQAVAAAINAAEGGIARAVDAVSVAIRAPASPDAQAALAARIEQLAIRSAEPPARVVVNARTGTVVIGGNVRIRPAAVAHGNLTVAVSEQFAVSQPEPFGRGQTVVTPNSAIEAREETARMALFAPGARLSDIVDAVNALGAAPGDLVAILEALREIGALSAELVVI